MVRVSEEGKLVTVKYREGRTEYQHNFKDIRKVAPGFSEATTSEAMTEAENTLARVRTDEVDVMLKGMKGKQMTSTEVSALPCLAIDLEHPCVTVATVLYL